MSPKYLLPQEVARPPIEEAVFEIRFKPASDAVVDRLPGQLLAALGTVYLQSESLKIANLPPERRKTQPEIRYQPRVKLSGRNAAIFIADSAASVRLPPPYPGWKELRTRIDALLDVLEAGELAAAVERISLKFINILRETPERQLDALNIEIRVAGEAAPDPGLHLRLELNDETYVRVVEVQPGSTGPLVEGQPDARGLMMSLDCVHHLAGEDFWSQRSELIENLHFELRALFFRLLTRASIERLGPIYRTEPERG